MKTSEENRKLNLFKYKNSNTRIQIQKFKIMQINQKRLKNCTQSIVRKVSLTKTVSSTYCF